MTELTAEEAKWRVGEILKAHGVTEEHGIIKFPDGAFFDTLTLFTRDELPDQAG